MVTKRSYLQEMSEIAVIEDSTPVVDGLSELSLPINQLRRLALSAGYTRVYAHIYTQLRQAANTFLKLLVHRCKLLLDLTKRKMVRDWMVDICGQWEGLSGLPRPTRIKKRRRTCDKRTNKTSNGVESKRESKYLYTQKGLIFYHAPIQRFLSSQIKIRRTACIRVHQYLEVYMRQSLKVGIRTEVRYRHGLSLPLGSTVRSIFKQTYHKRQLSSQSVSDVVSDVSKDVWSILYDLISLRSLVSPWLLRKKITAEDLQVCLAFRKLDSDTIQTDTVVDENTTPLRISGFLDSLIPRYSCSFFQELSQIIRNMITLQLDAKVQLSVTETQRV